MKPFSIGDAAFNISMTCNLTCEGCESFNNYNFKGQVKFADYADYYKEWSKKLNIKTVTIHGGEPFTNPDILNWVTNLKRLWPTADEYYVATNGTILRNKITVARQVVDQGYFINVTVHDPAMYEDIRNQLEEVLEPYDYLIRKMDLGYEYYDKHTEQIYGLIEYNYHFKKSAIDYIKDKTWYMHRSDPTQAYKTCLEDLSPCNFFHKGMLYQCQLTALRDDLFLQFSIEPEAVDLLKKYKHGDPFYPMNKLRKFFKSHNRPIPQCTLCPGCPDTHPIFPMAKKKIKF